MTRGQRTADIQPSLKSHANANSMDMKLSTVLFSNFLRFVKNTDVPILLCLVYLREKI